MANNHNQTLINQPFIGNKILSASLTLTGMDSGKAFVNTSATGTTTISLPKAIPGLTYQFLVQAAFTMNIQPKAVDSIRGSGAGVLLALSGVGSTLTLECMTPGIWEIVQSGSPNGGLPFYRTGSFTGTLTGMTTVVTGLCNYSIVGNVCTLSMPPSFQGTSNTTAMTMTGLPAVCQPATLTQIASIPVVDNGLVVAGVIEIFAGSGTVAFLRQILATGNFTATAFTASGAKGLAEPVVTYLLL